MNNARTCGKAPARAFTSVKFLARGTECSLCWRVNFGSTMGFRDQQQQQQQQHSKTIYKGTIGHSPDLIGHNCSDGQRLPCINSECYAHACTCKDQTHCRGSQGTGLMSFLCLRKMPRSAPTIPAGIFLENPAKQRSV